MATKKRTSSTKTTAVNSTKAKAMNARKTSKKDASVNAKEMEYQSPSIEQTQKSSMFRPQLFIGLLVVLVVLGFLFKSMFVVAVVNGHLVSRAEFNKQLEQQAGKQVMQSLVTKQLIFQEAARKHITISDAQINGQEKKINDSLSKQGQTLDQALSSRGMSKTDFVDQLKIQLIAEKLLAKDIAVSDQEVNDYIDKNKDSLPTDQDPMVLRASVLRQLQQQKLSEKFQALVASLQKSAKINYFITL